MVPLSLVHDFERMVFECYCSPTYGYYDVPTLAQYVEDFAIYAESHEKMGGAFVLSDDESLTDADSRDIIARRFDEVMDEVVTVLDYHRMFYQFHNFLGVKYHNTPVHTVW